MTNEPAVGKRSGLTAVVDSLVGYDVFISYSREDGREYARKLHEQLDRISISAFLDERELPSGTSLRAELVRALRRSGVLLVVASPLARKSDYVALEIEEFARRPRPIIPIVFAGGGHALPWKVVQARDLVWIDETGDEPSGATLTAIETSLRITRRRAMASRMMLTVAATILGLSIVAAFFAARAAVEGERAAKAVDELVVKEGKLRDETEKLERSLTELTARTRAAQIESLARVAVSGNTSNDVALLLAREAFDRLEQWKMATPSTADHALRQAVFRNEGFPLLPGSLDARVSAVAMTADSRWLAVALRKEQEPSQILIYDTQRPLGPPVRRLLQQGGVGALAITRDSRRVLAGSVLWDLGKGSKPSDLRAGSSAQQPHFSEDGRWLAVGATLFDLEAGMDRLFSADDSSSPVSISGDGQWTVRVSTFVDRSQGIVLSVLLHRIADLKNRAAAEVRPALALAATPTTHASGPPTTPPWMPREPTLGKAGPGDFAPPHGATFFSPRSGWVVGVGPTIFLRNLRPGARFAGADRLPKGPNAFSNDDKYFVVGGDGEPRLYDLNGTVPRAVRMGSDLLRQSGSTAVGFSPDGRWLAVAGARTLVWDLRSRRFDSPRFVLPQEGPVDEVRFSPDGRWLVTEGDAPMLWDLSQQHPDSWPVQIRGSVPGTDLVFSSDSRYLLAIGTPTAKGRTDAAAVYRVWPLVTKDLVAAAGALAGRKLTRAEWSSHLPGEPFPAR